MAKTIYVTSNTHFTSQTGDFLALDNAATNTQVDVKKHLKSLAGRILITATGTGGPYTVTIKINPLIRVQKRNLEEADEIVYSWTNPNTLEYEISLASGSTWNSGSVFGKLPIHSFELSNDGSQSDGVDIVFVPFSVD
tara:strand:- start:5899 stop:6312 length:414 start_codon:yes stop_codon:yes gene_type:complete